MNPLKFDVQLSEKGHLDPDKHYIGEALPEPSFVSDLDGISRVGESSIPAREDHTHAGTVTDGISLAQLETILEDYYTQLEVDALLADYVLMSYLLANYYDNTEVYTKAEVDFLLAGVGGGGIDITDVLHDHWWSYRHYYVSPPSDELSDVLTFPAEVIIYEFLGHFAVNAPADTYTVDLLINGSAADTLVFASGSDDETSGLVSYTVNTGEEVRTKIYAKANGVGELLSLGVRYYFTGNP